MQPVDQQTQRRFTYRPRQGFPAARCIDIIDDPRDDPAAGAWPRWFARTFDVWWETGLVALVAGTILCRTSPLFLRWLDTPFGWKAFGLVCIPFGLLLDAALQALAGNTPGKAMLGLRVLQSDGRPLRFGEQLGRNLCVWTTGLGCCLPVIGLLAMVRQGLRLRNRLPASYDGRYYVVRSRPVGWARKGLFGLLFTVLFATVVVLDAVDRQDSREMATILAAPRYGWVNQETGRIVAIAPQWRYESQVDDEGRVEYRFTHHSGRAVVVLASEQNGDAAFAGYVRGLRDRLNDRFLLAGGHAEDFRGRPSWASAGEARDGAVRVQLRVLQVKGKAWRLMVMQAPPAAYTDDLVQELMEELWYTVAPP